MRLRILADCFYRAATHAETSEHWAPWFNECLLGTCSAPGPGLGGEDTDGRPWGQGGWGLSCDEDCVQGTERWEAAVVSHPLLGGP